jgi:hypothetical protein
MADTRQLSVSHSRERRSTADDSTLPCGLKGVLVAKDGTMMYISKMNINGKNGSSHDALKKSTNVVIPKKDITVVHDSSSLK